MMPKYDYICRECDLVEERAPLLADRDEQACVCGLAMERQFPATTSNYQSGDYTASFQPFEAHYDEALDCDVNGRREKKEILTALNLQEAGDAVGGARNLEKDPNAKMIKPTAPTGRRLADIQREQDAARKEQTFADVGVQYADGTEKKVDVNQLQTLK